MRPETQLDFAVFQLTPSQDRCELHVVAHGQSYRLASGLLKPFLAHLSTLEDQISQGAQSIQLEPSDPSSSMWFTKGTVERFVRFVSTPEILERVSTIEMELLEVSKAIRAQANNALEQTQTAEDDISKTTPYSISHGGNYGASENLEQTVKVQESMDGIKGGLEESTTRWLLRALDARWVTLQKEQEMAFGRAIAAGFIIKHVGDLVLFAESFGAHRLREACIRFMAFCQRRQESGMWIEDIDQVTGSLNQDQGRANENMMQYMRPKEYPDVWPDIHSGDAKLMELRRASFPIEGPLPVGENGLEKLSRQRSMDAELRQHTMLGGFGADYNNSLAWSMSRQAPVYARNHLGPPEEMHSLGLGHLEGSGQYIDMGLGRIHGLGRGQPSLPSWQGQPQSQYIQGNPPHRPTPSALPSSVVFPTLAQHGVGYSQSFESAYVHQTYNESNQWKMHAPPAAPSQYWPGNKGDNKSPQLIMNEQKMDTTLNTSVAAPSQHLLGTEGDTKSSRSVITEHNMDASLTSAAAPSAYLLRNQVENKSPQPIVNEQKMNETLSNQQQAVSSRELVLQKELHEEPTSISKPAELVTGNESTQILVNNDLSNEFVLEVSANNEETPRPEDTQKILHLKDDHLNNQGLSLEMDEEPAMRRLPRRASSPSRRSVSPLRKVQIARSGSGYRRSGSFTKRSIYSAHDVHNVADNSTESSEGETEDDKQAEYNAKAIQEKVEHARVRVQDVIGLFESKKEDSNDVKRQPISRRLSSKTSVLSRWSDDGVQTSSQSFSPGDKNTSIITKKDLLVEEKGVKLEEGTSGTDLFAEEEKNNEKQASGPEITPAGQCLEQPAEDSLITSEPHISTEMHNLDDGNYHSEDVLVVQDGHDATGPCEDHVKDILKDDIKDEDEPHCVENAVSEHLDSEFQDKSGKKTSEKEAKVKAVQEMLEKRKSSSGGKLNKPTPLAMAQSRAEKLRAYKAGLQQCKKEKEEEERKRIEGLKTQRRERIASRTNPVNVCAPDTPTTNTTPTKRTSRTPPLQASKSLPTVSHKLSNPTISPSLGPANGPANSLPSRNKISKPSGNTSSTSARELNPLSQSVPSFNEISKENLKSSILSSTASVRASTGSQRFSQLQKKTLKDADANNQEDVIKKRPITGSAVTSVRKGISSAIKDSTSRGDISSPSEQKPTKFNSPASAASKHKKRAVRSSDKGVAMENDKKDADPEVVNVVNDISVDDLVLAGESKVDATKEERNVETAEAEGDDNLIAAVVDVDSMQEQENNHAQIRDPLLLSESEIVGIIPAEPDSPSIKPETSDVNDNNVNDSTALATSDDAMTNSVQDLKDASYVQDLKDASYVHDSSFNGESTSTIEQTRDSGSANIIQTEDCQDPVAQVPFVDDNSTVTGTEESEYYEKDKYEIPALFPSQQKDLFSESPVVTSSKSLPRLIEAIQQAHSPEIYPIQSNKSRKKWGDSGSQKSSKDHQQAKGLKRFLFLGRKSHRSSSAHNLIEVDEDIDEFTDMITSHNNNKNGGDAMFVSNSGNQVTSSSSGIQGNVSGSSSGKGSRSFFSLSALRGKGEGKAS